MPNPNAIPVFSPLLCSEVMLATQAQAEPVWTREQKLYLAVLTDAIDCAFTYIFSQRKREQRLDREAMEWVLDDNISWPVSFINCCHAIRVDPDYMRQGILKRREQIRKKAFETELKRNVFLGQDSKVL